MSAFIYTTGPVHIYSQNITTGSYGYIGTCETTPEIKFSPNKLPVMNDVAGRSIPLDYIEEGTDATISCVFTRFDRSVLDQCLYYNSVATGGGNGYETRLNRGSLVKAFKLILQFSFYGTAEAQSGLLPGYRFAKSFVAAYVPSPVGTEASKCGVVFQAYSSWNSTTGAFVLYDNATDISSAYVPN